MSHRKKQRRLHRHHRKPKSLGGTGCQHNISMVCQFQHRSWHHLFWNHDVHTIAKIINDTWLDPDWQLVPMRRHT